jgi:hypothetical protein
MRAIAPRLFAFVDTLFGFNAPVESHGAPWSIFSGAMLFGGCRMDR